MPTASMTVDNRALPPDAARDDDWDDMPAEQVDRVVARIVTESDSVPVAAFGSSI